MIEQAKVGLNPNYEVKENVLLYDWISITSKIHSPDQIKSLLGISCANWELTKGAHGYRDRYYWNCISIHFNGRDDMGVWLELSGQGCRAFETAGHGDYGFLFWFVKQHPEDVKITRLDVAFDDHTGILDIDRVASDTRAGLFVSKMKFYECIYSTAGTSVVIGSAKSAVLVRIYDKARERNCTDGRHWIRVEIQMRDSRAKEFINLDCDFGQAFAGVLVNYLRYVEPDEKDSNMWRWSLQDYWANLVGEAAALSIYSKPGQEYNRLHCENYVFHAAGSAIDALLQIYGIDDFFKELQKKKPSKPNPKYARMVEYEKQLQNDYVVGDLIRDLEVFDCERYYSDFIASVPCENDGRSGEPITYNAEQERLEKYRSG